MPTSIANWKLSTRSQEKNTCWGQGFLTDVITESKDGKGSSWDDGAPQSSLGERNTCAFPGAWSGTPGVHHNA